MTRFPRRTVLLILAVLVLVSIGLRYPLVSHERYQSDSYFIHDLSGSIVHDGYAKWTLHPLSYFGFYPMSYPSGIPFIVAELSTMSGLSVELSILLIGIGFAILFCLTVFCLAREFVMRPELALLAAFFALLAPRFLDTTYWCGSARGPEVVFLTLLAFVGFRASLTQRKPLWVLCALIILASIATHRMSVLLVLYGVAFVLTALGFRYTRSNSNNRVRRWVVAAVMILGAGAMLSTLFYFELLGLSVRMSFEDSKLFNFGSPTTELVLSAAVAYTHQIGFILPVAFFGIAKVFKRSRLTPKGLFPVMLLLAFIPVIGSSLYVSMLMAPFVSVLGVMWLGTILRSERRRILACFVVLLLVVGSLGFTVWSVQRWNTLVSSSGDTAVVDDRLFNDGNYLHANAAGAYAISSEQGIYLQIQSMTDLRFVKKGIRAAINGDVTSQDFKGNVTFSGADFPVNLYSWFIYEGTANLYDLFVRILMVNGVPNSNYTFSGESYWASHSNIFVIVDNRHPTQFTDMWFAYDSKFLPQLHDAKRGDGTQMESYAIYQSQTITSYIVQLP